MKGPNMVRLGDVAVLDGSEPPSSIIWGAFTEYESPAQAIRSTSRDDNTTIFYLPASMAVGGCFSPFGLQVRVGWWR
ncbi:hypothetical protein Scep_001714 [Stephania cephalantha]|uniref:Uncharacterized protein n=1 Tax=Stephania cephalantha TaxID=152367 RepID=A0AAP0Q484_9MAGN